MNEIENSNSRIILFCLKALLTQREREATSGSVTSILAHFLFTIHECFTAAAVAVLFISDAQYEYQIYNSTKIGW